MAAKENFSDNYLVLKPKHGGILDLFHLLCSHNVEKSMLVDVSGGHKVTEFKRRLIMVNSVLIQKALYFLDKPMARFGSSLEMWVNLLNCNRNFFVLLVRLFQGRVMIPDRTSATFISAIGNLDRRAALDKNIKIGDCRYIVELSVMASKIAYENEAFIRATVENQWQMEFLGFYDFWNDYLERFSTQAFMLYDKRVDKIVIAFRGTSPYDANDWSTDFDISWYKLSSINCKVHGGFMKALGLRKNQGWPKEIKNVDPENDRQVAYYTIREKLKCMLLRNNKSTKFIITGHSLGGALAILFPMVLLLHEETELLERLEGVYTFGQPRVGDERLGRFMDQKLSLYGVKYFRFVYCNDIVPRLPHDSETFLFKHFGTCVYYNSFYQGKIVKEEPNKNYSSLIWQIPKNLNAAWELIRSFIMVFWKGPDYAEGWSLRFLRVIGLVFPGASAHSLQDYVNAVRLESRCCCLMAAGPNASEIGELSTTILVYALYISVFSIIFSIICIRILWFDPYRMSY